MYFNPLTKRLKIEYPIIQAPMAGGVTTSNLVAAVSNAGGLGMIGAGYMTAQQIRDQIREIKQLTSKPFGINLFVPSQFDVSASEVQTAMQPLRPIREQLNIVSENPINIPTYQDTLEKFLEQIRVVIEENVPVCTFTFGLPSEEVVKELKQKHILLMGTATTVEEVTTVEKSGMDMVVVQGSEAGGHRGNFIKGHQESLVGLMSLIPQAADHVTIPIVAAGGIMDGRGLTASMCLGAMGVQMGTAFLACVESGAHPVHKEAILNGKEDQTVLTRAFSGKYARGIQNQFIEMMQKEEMVLPDFPVQNTLTQDIRKASATQNNPSFMSLWSGQSPRLAKNQTVEELIKTTMAEAELIKR